MLKKESSAIEYINKILQSDIFNRSIPDKFLTDINDKKIKISLKDIDYCVIIYIKNNSLIVLDESSNFDVEIVTTPATLILFILSKGSDKFSSKIVINGDIDTANKFNKFLSSSEKIKEIIMHIIGEDKTSFLEDKISTFSSTFRDFFRSSSNDIIDLLIDDLSILPSKSEVDQYLDEVDSLKSRTDQLYKKYKNVK